VTPEWVVLELSPQGEEEDPEVLLSALKRRLRVEVEVFVPASVSIVGDSRISHKLIDNYVFVRRTLRDSAYLQLEGTKYVSSVLTARKGRVRHIVCVTDKDIDQMRRQISVETEQGINVGDEVQVMSGPYKGINGRVIEEIPETDSVQVYIQLRSKQAIVTLPRSFLWFVSKENSAEVPVFSPFLNKIIRVREWVKGIRPVVLWTSKNWIPIAAQLSKHARISEWVERGARLFRELQAPSVDSLQRKYLKVQRQTELISKLPAFFELLSLGQGLEKTQLVTGALSAKLKEVQRFHDVMSRFEAIQEAVGGIEAALVEWRLDMVENLLFDGHNLAYRVMYALGAMRVPLTDPEGQPTGMIYGFLKSLAGFKKRFPNAKLHVIWDGSPQRRVLLYQGYKANRRKADGSSSSNPQADTQMARLRGILGSLGVYQACNQDEETDDVIACLVRGKLKGQRNIIVSTDRDFLQLVTYTDLLLTPKVGNRPETLYDRDKVVEEYGVTPDRMVHLRALLGDSSDNIPGVPRVPTKVLTALVNTHGTVDALCASSLAGVTPAQYEKIRAAEEQIRLNVELMTLRTDLSFEESPVEPNAPRVSEFLGGLNIQAEPIIGPFFQEGSQGFLKSS